MKNKLEADFKTRPFMFKFYFMNHVVDDLEMFRILNIVVASQFKQYIAKIKNIYQFTSKRRQIKIEEAV